MAKWQLNGYAKINLKTIKYVYVAQQNISIFIVGTVASVDFKTLKPSYFQLSVLLHVRSSSVRSTEVSFVKNGAERRKNYLYFFILRTVRQNSFISIIRTEVIAVLRL